MKLPPPSRRSRCVEGPDEVTYIIPGPRNPFVGLFLGAWLVGWALGECFAIGTLLSRAPMGVKLFLCAWLTMWTLGGGFALYAWLWNLVGTEIIGLRSSSLTHRREIFGRGRAAEYDLSAVHNLRVSAAYPAVLSGRVAASPVPAGGLIAFDYGAKTFRMGGSIDEAEAALLVEELKTWIEVFSGPPPGET